MVGAGSARAMWRLGLLACLLCATAASCARILAVLPIPSVSHQVVFQPVVKELARRGHDVVTISPNPIGDPTIKNLHEINMTKAYRLWNDKFNFALSHQHGFRSKEYAQSLFEGMIHICESMLQIPEVARMLSNPNERFHMVIVEWLFCPMIATFGHRFQAPLVYITTTHAFTTGHDAVGNPTHPVYFPDFFLPYGQPLNFWQRLHSTYYSVWFGYYYYWYIIPLEDRIARKYFGDMPYLGDIINNASLLLTNTHPILGGARPLVPTTIEFGGGALHKKPHKPLPKDLQEFLDESESGAVYFSLGSNVKSAYVDAPTRNEIVAAFAELPYRFLWKWELDTYQGLPENVKIKKWFPQQDVLRHKNIKAFFMQGGLQSLEEALLYKVPLVVMPFLADQDYNANKIERLGIGVSLKVNHLTKEQVKHAIGTVINDTKYKERMARISAQVHDSPMEAKERVMWWLEYTLRHKGTALLRSPAVAAPLYKLGTFLVRNQLARIVKKKQ